MKLDNRWFAQLGAFLLLLLACGMTLACNSKPSSHALAGADSATHIDVLCLGDRINNPSEPFHYSYKYSDATSSLDNEADITPQEMTITRRDNSGTHSFHGIRSDEASWNGAVLDLSSLRFTGMSARLDALNGTSAITPQGSESVNGYTATKYVIDTTHASAADQERFAVLFGKGSSEKGILWQPADGCAAKLVLDDTIVQNDGTVNQGHYEIARIKR